MNAWAAILDAAVPAKRAFEAALADPATAQLDLLRRILSENATTEFGRRYQFGAIGDADDYRARVPPETHGDRAGDIGRIAAGATNVRTRDAVIAFEQTGGSSAGAKLVPYTRAGLASFQAAVLPWLADLIEQRPGLAHGRIYFSISPATRRPTATEGGLPIGLPSDAAYLGDAVAAPFASLSAVPLATAALADFEAWRAATLAHLLAAEDLTLISVWSPTFLTRLMSAAPAVWPTIAAEVHRIAGATRARAIEQALATTIAEWQVIWPHLDTVSCWTDATSARAASELALALPYAHLQGKGVLATEGVISIPLMRAAFPVPALTSTLLEFVEQGDAIAGNSRLVTQLEDGGVYRVLMTTPGGFYRYDIGDLVRCRGFLGRVPMLEFVGRAGLVSDLVGEKLTEEFVASRLPRDARFAMLVADTTDQLRYVLVIDRIDQGRAATWAADLDRRLGDNPQYAYARQLGQLAPVRLIAVADAEATLARVHLDRGGRLGDLKAVALSTDTSLLRVLANTALMHNS